MLKLLMEKEAEVIKELTHSYLKDILVTLDNVCNK